MTREGLKLLRAANDGNVDQIIALLNAGFSGNEPNEKGMTPLHFAADTGKLEAVRVLLARQANVHSRTTAGLTPLMIAVRRGHSDIVGLLLDAGAGQSAQEQQVA